MSGSSGGFGKGSSSGRTRVHIPEFLQPFLRQSADVAGGALSNLQRQAGGNLVAPFNQTQQLAQTLGVARALGQGGYLPQAQETFLEAAQGQDVANFVPSFQPLMAAAQGQGLESFLSPEALNSFRQATGGVGAVDILSSLSHTNAVPGAATDVLTGLAQGGQIPGQDVLAQLAGQNAVDDATLDTLRRTASGDFLYGGEGFDAAVDAAMRAATPGILSTFGRAGSGGATGGLAQTAIAQSGIDAFARQFAQERQNQLSATDALARIGFQSQGQRLGAASALGNLGLAGTGQQADIASTLVNIGLGASGTLAGLGADERARQLAAAGQIGEFGLAERANQLRAAGVLPDLAGIDIGLLSSVGQQQQDLAQARLEAPFNAQLQLLSAALGGLPISSLLGSNTSGRETSATLGWAPQPNFIFRS